MAYSTYTKKTVTKEISTNAVATLRSLKLETPDTVQFFELEAAVVLDVIQDETHPIFKEGGQQPKIIKSEWPVAWNDDTKVDYSYIGRVKARPINSAEQTPWDELTWFTPLDSTFKEWPLVNEMIVVVRYLDGWYYQRKINTRNFINNSGDYRWEQRYGKAGPVSKFKSNALKKSKIKSNISPECNMVDSYLGRYFRANHHIRPLKHYEGDTIIESRFGSSVRFGCYEDNPTFDIGTSEGDGESYDDNRGNPMILIRNRQRPLKPATENDEENERIYQHTILEDINNDGSSIQITSGKTISKFKHTLGGSSGSSGSSSPPKKKGGLDGLSNLSKSDVGTGEIKSIAEPTLDTAKTAGSAAEKAGKTYAETAYGPQLAAAKAASNSDLGGAMTANLSAAVGPENGKAVGKRFDGMSTTTAAKFIDTGESSQALTNGASGGVGISASVGTSGASSQFMSSVGKGEFTLNPTFETGIVSSIKAGTSAGKSSLLSSKSGPGISAANALGIDIPGADAMGMTPNDSPMFKVFKLASFGLRSICAGQKGKTHGSKTENELGWMLSISINLELLAILAAIFARLRNLKFNFGLLAGFDLNNLLFDLCDWVNQIEYGSSLADTFKGEATKMLNPKELTMFAGNKLTQDGNYDTYARGNPDFDMQYKSLIGDGSALKAAAGAFGQTSLSLEKGSSQVATMSFDPISGLYRETPTAASASASANLEMPVNPNMGAISYDTSAESGIQFSGNTTATASTSTTTTTSSVGTSDSQTSTTTTSSTPTASPTPTATPTATPTPSTTTPDSATPPPTTSPATTTSTPPATTSQSQVATSQGEVPQNPDKVKNFHNGEEISREDLKGTHLENADMNAVSLLHPEDLESLKDTPQVNKDLEKAKKEKDTTFDKKMDAVEKKVKEESTAGTVMFGKQLPQLDGNQIVINSERIIVSAKTKEMIHYAKGKYGVATDDEITMNCIDRFVTETKTHTSVISPTIHLGAYITRRHPVLKGDVATAWLGSLCGWLSGHVHHDPYITTSAPAQQGSLAGLRARLPTLLSTRVFIDG